MSATASRRSRVLSKSVRKPATCSPHANKQCGLTAWGCLGVAGSESEHHLLQSGSRPCRRPGAGRHNLLRVQPRREHVGGVCR
eukprot:5258022-Amphidinium_carterae.2